MPELWMPGATRLDVGDHASTDGGKPKAIAHVTWDEDTDAAHPLPLVPYERLVDWFGRNPDGKPSAPHILWDPFTGRFTQFLPANSRSKSLADKQGVGTRTNRAGSVVLQIEALFFAHCIVGGKVYTRLADTPCKGWPQLLAWIRSWGVPDRWPMGRPTDYTSRRDEETWETEGGWYAHAHVPENDHTDPGSWPAFTSEEDDMALTDDDLKRIALAVLGYKGKLASGAQDPRDVYGYIRDTEGDTAPLGAQVKALVAKVDALTAKVGSLETTGLTPAQVAAIAKAVNDDAATRLAN